MGRFVRVFRFNITQIFAAGTNGGKYRRSDNGCNQCTKLRNLPLESMAADFGDINAAAVVTRLSRGSK